jgi:hypothetical protein
LSKARGEGFAGRARLDAKFFRFSISDISFFDIYRLTICVSELIECRYQAYRRTNMTRFQISQLASVAMSVTFVALTWMATLTLPPVPLQLAAAPVAVELA